MCHNLKKYIFSYVEDYFQNCPATLTYCLSLLASTSCSAFIPFLSLLSPRHLCLHPRRSKSPFAPGSGGKCFTAAPFIPFSLALPSASRVSVSEREGSSNSATPTALCNSRGAECSSARVWSRCVSPAVAVALFASREGRLNVIARGKVSRRSTPCYSNADDRHGE